MQKRPHIDAAVVRFKGYGEAESGIEGEIRFVQVLGSPTFMRGNITGLPPGKHGLTIHELGDVNGDCGSLGDHYNPTQVSHGGPVDVFRHAGDLGNIEANADGLATVNDSDHIISISSIVGRGLAIHSKADDLGRGGDKESLRTGNSGPPIACGVISWSKHVPTETSEVEKVTPASELE